MKDVLYNKQIQKVPVKLWTKIEEVESAALDQLKRTASLPFVFKHVAVMPDVHLGRGATVGSVVPTKDALCPAAVGVDIGCGMMAVKTNLNPNVVQERADKIRQSVERSIPLGFNVHRPDKISKEVENWAGWRQWDKLKDLERKLYQKAVCGLGTLGGGNHFIEVCLDTENNVWVMLHSGSRGIGNIIARQHMDKAKADMKKMFISLPDPDLAYFVQGTKDFQEYWHDLQWLQSYAFKNRVEMMRVVLKDLSYAIYGEFKELPRLLEVNCHHNYAALENHFGQNIYVTRKGAVRARKDDLGIIPGSMGAKSYIVKGLGNEQSFNSCSHGAGRKMSRTQAKKHFTTQDLIEQTKGIVCKKDASVLDEIPGAYKDIDQVMDYQKDLVEVLYELRQIICVKG